MNNNRLGENINIIHKIKTFQLRQEWSAEVCSRSASHYQFTFDACCVGGGKNNYYLLTTQGLGCGPLVTSKARDQKDPQTRGLASYPWSEMRKDIPLRLTLSYYQQSFEKKNASYLRKRALATPNRLTLPCPHQDRRFKGGK